MLSSIKVFYAAMFNKNDRYVKLVKVQTEYTTFECFVRSPSNFLKFPIL